MKSAIIKANSIEEFETVEPCFISELWNRPEDANVSVAKARVKLGIKTRFHYLKGVNERYLIVAGNGVVEVEDLSPTEVEAGDLVVIPAGKKQRIENIGETDLVFYCICNPRFTPDCNRFTE